jgi:hypothetical protein
LKQPGSPPAGSFFVSGFPINAMLECRYQPGLWRWFETCLSIVAAVSLAAILPAAGAASETEAVISTAIEQLGAEQFAAREAASQRLAAAGAAAVNPLVAAAAGADPERALRAVDILRQLLACDDAELVAAAEAGLETLAGQHDLAIAQRAEVALDFHDAALAVSAREMLEQLGAVFDEAGPFGLRVEIDENWRGDSRALRLLTRLRQLTYVSFHGVRLEAKDALTLSRLRRIERIDLFGAGFSDEVVTDLQQRLPGAEIDVRKGGKLGIAGAPLMGQCLVSGVQAGSAADKAGLRPQDIIVEIDGQPVPDFNVCTQLIGRHGPGDKVELLVERRQPNGATNRFRQTVELGGW